MPPFFAEPFNKWIILREELTAGTEVPPYPFVIGGEPFLPAARPLLARRQQAEVRLMTYHLSEGTVAIESRVVKADGQELSPPKVEVVERGPQTPAGLGGLKTTFDVGLLEAGDYRFEVTVTDAAGRKASSSAPFVVGGRR